MPASGSDHVKLFQALEPIIDDIGEAVEKCSIFSDIPYTCSPASTRLCPELRSLTRANGRKEERNYGVLGYQSRETGSIISIPSRSLSEVLWVSTSSTHENERKHPTWAISPLDRTITTPSLSQLHMNFVRHSNDQPSCHKSHK